MQPGLYPQLYGDVQHKVRINFKSPQQALSAYPEHDLFVQQAKLENTLRWLMDEGRYPV